MRNGPVVKEDMTFKDILTIRYTGLYLKLQNNLCNFVSGHYGKLSRGINSNLDQRFGRRCCFKILSFYSAVRQFV